MPARSHCFSRIRRLLLAGCWLLASLIGLAFGHGGYHERLAYLTEEVKKNPSDPRLHFELGDLLGQHGDLKLSLDNLDRVDALASGKFQTDLLRGQALLVAGQPAKAKEALDRQIASQPECVPARLLRARASQRIGEGAASLADYLMYGVARRCQSPISCKRWPTRSLRKGARLKPRRCWPKASKNSAGSLRLCSAQWTWRSHRKTLMPH